MSLLILQIMCVYNTLCVVADYKLCVKYKLALRLQIGHLSAAAEKRSPYIWEIASYASLYIIQKYLVRVIKKQSHAHL